MEIIYRESYDRWIKGDRYIRPLIRRIVRGKPRKLSGMQVVVRNFLIGLERKKIAYNYNRLSLLIGKNKKVISFGLGQNGVKGIKKKTPIIAAIGFPYPGELPSLCQDYNVKKFLQHSQWVLDFVKSAKCYDDHIFDLWPAGINTDEWKPTVSSLDKEIDILIYNKIHWEKNERNNDLLQPIKRFLASRNLKVAEIIYGQYSPEEYYQKLAQARVMIFLSAHESQGLAYQECLSCNIPVMAWDPGCWLDPVRINYGKSLVSATSVPFFNEECGVTFADYDEFNKKFDLFYENAMLGKFNPRGFVLENLSIEKSTERMLDIYNSI